jgi:hypothetical protein
LPDSDSPRIRQICVNRWTIPQARKDRFLSCEADGFLNSDDGRQAAVGRATRLALVVVCLASGTLGCSRAFYRRQADRDVAEIYAEKRAEEAFTLPPLPWVGVDPRSRFFDPSPDDCPALPDPVPRLNAYRLPPLKSGDPQRSAGILDDDPAAGGGEMERGPGGELPIESPSDAAPEGVPLPEASPEAELPAPEVQPASFSISDRPAEASSSTESATQPQLPQVGGAVRLAHLIRQYGELREETNGGTEDQLAREADEQVAEEGADARGLRIVPIPEEFWRELPETCLPRMLEFSSVRTEYRRSFPDISPQQLAGQLSDAPRLTLPMICELASINSREFQTRKERLYLTALALTAERFDYLLRPTRRGNGTGVAYNNFHIAGVQQGGLSVPSGAAVTRTTALAGQFLASFANDVVLTFEGPQGFFANISTELLFDFQQTIFQRDVVFESLTQSERNVVYAARDLIRYQRGLFVNLATRYYQLLLTYRQIEISSQDYFSNLRAFLQGRAEYLQAGRIPRVQVDQFEQNALGSRSSLVRDCNSLETALDRLKLDIGLPPEMPLNINLDELEALTSSDELTVTRQLVLRTKRTLIDAVDSRRGDWDAAVNAATVLVKRLQDTLNVRREMQGDETIGEAERLTKRMERRLALLEARLKADQLQAVRDREIESDLPPATLIQFARTIDLIDALLEQADRAVAYRRDLDEADRDPESVETIREYQAELDDLQTRWDAAIEARQFDELNNLVDAADALLQRSETLTRRVVGDLLPQDRDALEDIIIQVVNETIELVDQVDTADIGGLDEVEVENEKAMLLALFQRLDLANQRGDVADARRQIKLAADDLRAILDFRATQTLVADRSVDDFFNFSADGNRTRLSMSLDTPLNRRIERNVYRAALIDYNRARRALIEQEDQIKFDVREDLRQLRLRRNQYEISVARAALAYERVVSTRLQLQLAVGNVVARDFLEAQQAYTSALNSVAGDHISFILGRIGLFFDTESIRLNESIYWSGVRDESLDLPPVPDFSEVNPNPWGSLPEWLHYSDEVRANH